MVVILQSFCHCICLWKLYNFFLFMNVHINWRHTGFIALRVFKSIYKSKMHFLSCVVYLSGLKPFLTICNKCKWMFIKKETKLCMRKKKTKNRPPYLNQSNDLQVIDSIIFKTDFYSFVYSSTSILEILWDCCNVWKKKYSFAKYEIQMYIMKGKLAWLNVRFNKHVTDVLSTNKRHTFNIKTKIDELCFCEATFFFILKYLDHIKLLHRWN